MFISNPVFSVLFSDDRRVPWQRMLLKSDVSETFPSLSWSMICNAGCLMDLGRMGCKWVCLTVQLQAAM